MGTEVEHRRRGIWLSEVEAFDSKKDSDLQRFRNNRALTKKGAVEDLCNTYSSSQGFADQKKAATYLASRLVTVSDIQPTRPTSSMLRLIWADMSQLGLAHSRHVDEIFSHIKESREHHPNVTAAVVVMPNTPKSGKGLKADAARDSNIKEAVDAVRSTLMTYGGLVHERVCSIIDPESMYSTDRPVTLEFLEIVSEQKQPDGEFRSLFTKGYTYRRRGVPELLDIMHLSQFVGYEFQSLSCLTCELGG